ncbi:MAG: sigma-54-dependent Fis family transcriptional regulator [Deltaproteobacteria bacterium]|nr:sigma-54-dependent Fis family transcriptional regulator [Deltaproteobacteria bacterium]
MSNRDILLIEQNHKERTGLCKLLEGYGYTVTTASDGLSGIKELKFGSFRLVIAGFETSGLDGELLLKQAGSGARMTPVLFVSSNASVEHAVDMMKEGAMDFILKPIDPSQVRLIVERAFSNDGPRGTSYQRTARALRIVTQDKEMLRLLDLAKQVSDSKASVLIQGESGTGKELFARYIHQTSNRRKGPFVAVNCGALPEALLESELFGHEKGAFTGAVTRKIGKFEMADGGTLLLDEITEMAFHLQSKLLRALQEQEIDRVGGLRPVPVDVRVIATTNRNIQEAIGSERFRKDLFYRLNVIPIKVPPLRSRKDDIPLLVNHFIEKYNEIDGRNVKCLTKEALAKLCQIPFFGNVRELENIIERAVLLSDGQTIDEKDLLLEETYHENTQQTASAQSEILPGPLKEVEKKIIFRALDETNGNRTHAAKILGISVRTLRNKLNEYKGKMDAL